MAPIRRQTRDTKPKTEAQDVKPPKPQVVKPPKKSSDASAAAHAILKQKLSITPKTATMLMQLGYTDYRDLRTASPGLIVQQFKQKLGCTHKNAEAYRCAMRRIVWIGTQDMPEEHVKRCSDWTQKALRAKGVWSEEFDQLTGDDIDKLLRENRNG
jgi:hypothetical protein